jgi:hypothetical protein
MDQLLWVVGFIPKWAWFLCFVLSILVLTLAIFLKKFSVFALHSQSIYISASLMLVVSSWFLGYKTNDEYYQDQIKQTKEKIEVLEQKNQQLLQDLETKSVEKVRIIKEKGKTLTQYIEKEVFVDKEVVKYVQTCPILPNTIIDAHNKAVTLGEQQ